MIGFVWLFVMIRRESKKLIIKTYRDIESEGIPELKCPKCNTYMEVGYTLASKGMLFRNRHAKFKWNALGKLIPNTANLGFSPKANLSWKCDNCKLIILDYSCQIEKGKS